MKIDELFLKEDRETVKNLLNEHERFMNLAKLALGDGDFRKAEDYATHAIKMLTEVRKLKELNEMYVESHKLKKQAKMQGLTDHMLSQRRNYF